MNLFEEIINLLSQEFGYSKDQVRDFLHANMADMDSVLQGLTIDQVPYAGGYLIIIDGDHYERLRTTLGIEPKCRRCGSDLTPIIDDDIEPRDGGPGELRCRDLTCPFSDYPQGMSFTEG